jgi:regulator of replication initiation timing
MSETTDKRKKAHGEEIDISNGVLFLRIAELERQVGYLDRELNKLKRDVSRVESNTDFRIGGSQWARRRGIEGTGRPLKRTKARNMRA